MKLGTWALVGVFGLVPLTGCGSDTTAGEPPPATSPDGGADATVHDGSPQDTSTQDALLEDTATQDGSQPEVGTPDAAEEAAADAAPDQGIDAEPDAASVRPPGQCKADTDCGPGQTCTMTAPGGLCAGCGTENDCPDPLKFECFMATCQRTCTDDPDCPEGYECKSVGRCGLISCSTSCPAPYVCDGGFCRRPQCASTPPACPAGMTCGQDSVCVEQ